MPLTRQNSKTGPLNALKDFIDFLRGTWGILSGISLFFPFSNLLAKAIPVNYVDIDIFTVLSTIGSVFALFYTYASRDSYLDHDRTSTSNKKLLHITALISFVVGIVSFFGYLFLYLTEMPSRDINQSLNNWFVWLTSLLLYSLTFSLLTNAFTRLALSIYLFHDNSANNSSSEAVESIDIESILYGYGLLRGSHGDISKKLLKSKVSNAIKDRLGEKIFWVSGVNLTGKDSYTDRDKISPL